MIQASELKVVQETTPAARGTLLPCFCCGEAEVAVTLDLSDMETFTCASCENTFTAGQVRDFIGKWGKVLAAVDVLAGSLSE